MIPIDPSVRYWGSEFTTRDGGERRFTNIYTSTFQVKMCSRVPIEVAIRERREDDPPSPYWGWHAADRNYYTMVWPSRQQLDICFAYGPDRAEASGQGRVVNLIVEEKDAGQA